MATYVFGTTILFYVFGITYCRSTCGCSLTSGQTNLLTAQQSAVFSDQRCYQIINLMMVPLKIFKFYKFQLLRSTFDWLVYFIAPVLLDIDVHSLFALWINIFHPHYWTYGLYWNQLNWNIYRGRSHCQMMINNKSYIQRIIIGYYLGLSARYIRRPEPNVLFELVWIFLIS